MNKSLETSIAGVTFKNPVFAASGTFGCGREYSAFVDLNQLGGIMVKGVSDKPWPGNGTPRIAETYGGMLNSIGLQNNGVEAFVRDDLPFLKAYETKVIVNVCGHTVKEYASVVERLQDEPVDMLELNISCPNVSQGGISFGTDSKVAFNVVQEVKKHARQPLMVKLSPNVTSIVEIARAVEAGGADAVSLINTLLGMKIDIYKRVAVLKNKVGGLSGSAIKPVAVRMVYEVAKAVNVPVVGMGGISSGADAIEFIMAGAMAVAVGTANFTNPYATRDVLNGIAEYMDKYGVKDLKEIRGII